MSNTPNENLNKASLWQIFMTFAKIGCFTFGGGLAMLPLIERAVVEKNHWVSANEYHNMLAITNSAPGAFALNAALFMGYKLRGFWGALVAGLGIIIPSFVIIIVIALLLEKLAGNLFLDHFFKAVQPVIVAVIFAAGTKLGLQVLKSPLDIFIMLATFVILLLVGVNPILIIIAGGLIGLACAAYRIQDDHASKGGAE